ncbi:MAG: Ig-like domain-containing protein, partial [Pirellulaceae bacterium]|nr:Ig-like domain-containing protein [Pirellulaceae bacterium]
VLVRDLTDDNQGSLPSQITRLGTKLLLAASSDEFGRELFVTDLTNPNSAPVIDTAIDQLFADISEDNPNPRGKTILSLVSGVSDPDANSMRGIAITSLSSLTSGQWQYTLNGGQSWSDILAASITSSRLLPSNGAQSRIRFIPDANFVGTATVEYRAWDQTQGASGGVMDTTIAGGSSSFSLAVETATQSILAVNDAPVLDTVPETNLTAIDEDIQRPAGDPIELLLSAATDVDAGALRGIAITTVSGATNGTWQFTLNGGSTWASVGVVSRTSALLIPSNGTQSKLRYLPNPNFSGNLQVTFKAWDQSNGLAGSKLSVAASGGNTAFSLATETATLLVRAINDAPTLNATLDQDFLPINEDTFNSSGRTIASMVSGVADVDLGALKGIAITSFTGGTRGDWQYTLNGGVLWKSISPLTLPNALLLPSNGTLARIRFVPNADFNGEVRLLYRAWDQTTGTEELYVNVSSVGRNSAFSIATETAALRVLPVNDAPVLRITTSISLGTIASTNVNSAGFVASALLRDVSDVDANALRGVAIIGIGTGTPTGQWQYSIDSGANWNAIIIASTASALLLPGSARLRFVPSAGSTGRATLTFRAWDQTSGVALGTADLRLASSVGGVTAFSRLTRSAFLDIR